MTTPSVKGSILASAIEDVVQLRRAGRISDDALDARLERDDLELLDSKPGAADWYPMGSYVRLLELLGDIAGDPSDRAAYFVERGRANARRLMEAGLYQQLGFLERWREENADSSEAVLVSTYKSKLRLVISLARSIYNVGEWSVEDDPTTPIRVLTCVNGAGDYSEPMRLAAEGFLNECARAAGRDDDLYSSERPRPDRIVFHMLADIPDLGG